MNGFSVTRRERQDKKKQNTKSHDDDSENGFSNATIKPLLTLPFVFASILIFLDKLLLLLTLLFLQPLQQLTGWPLLLSRSGRLFHMHIIGDFLLTHSPPLFLVYLSLFFFFFFGHTAFS